jgi:hypothetical protein
MVATSVVSLPPRAERHRAVPARLLWIELRRNVMPWLLPIIAVVFWLDSYRTTLGQMSLWSSQTAITIGQGHPLIDFGPFVTGAAAWMGSRDGRRGTTDLVSVTARSRWAGQLVTWLATTAWALAGYVVLVGALYAVIADRVSWGRPPWWPVIAMGAGVLLFSTVGYVAGAVFPGRFVAPVAAFGAFVLLVMSSHAGFSDRVGAWSILPNSGQGGLGFGSGIFYPFLADLSLARLMALVGLSTAALGVLGLRSSVGGLRRALLAASVTLAGLAVAGTGIGLLGTARVEAHGVVIPLLDGGASDGAISYTPVCSAGALPVCLHPAYRSYLPGLVADLDPVLHEVDGLPGAPRRVAQVAASYGGPSQYSTVNVTASLPAFHLSLGNLDLRPAESARLEGQLRFLFLDAFVGAGLRPRGGTPAQQAVLAALLSRVGVSFARQPGLLAPSSSVTIGGNGGLPGLPQKGSPIYAIAERFASQPVAAQRAWLTSHLAALRSGDLTVDQLP